jgi:hypothetical protein
MGRSRRKGKILCSVCWSVRVTLSGYSKNMVEWQVSYCSNLPRQDRHVGSDLYSVDDDPWWSSLLCWSVSKLWWCARLIVHWSLRTRRVIPLPCCLTATVSLRASVHASFTSPPSVTCMPIARQRIGKHVPATRAQNSRASVATQRHDKQASSAIQALFSVRSVQSGYEKCSAGQE